MINDVGNLLQQLNQPEFDYREFDLSEQMPGYWPVFQTVMGHPLVTSLPGARRGSKVARPEPAARLGVSPQTSDAAPMPADARTENRAGAIFRRYQPASAGPSDPADEDVSGLLRRLSDHRD